MYWQSCWYQLMKKSLLVKRLVQFCLGYYSLGVFGLRLQYFHCVNIGYQPKCKVDVSVYIGASQSENLPLISCVACPSCLAGGEKETHWEWHCYHRVPGRGRRLVVLQTVDDPVALHPYPSLGWRGDYVTWSDVFASPFRSAFPLTRRPDIFALVRYNSQNDSYRWVLWSRWI